MEWKRKNKNGGYHRYLYRVSIKSKINILFKSNSIINI